MLYIMRHGKTDWNEAHKIQGRTDVPLNDAGRKMAREARDAYCNLHLDICYSSPLARAKETAEIFLENRDVPIITDSRLAEMSFGYYEGLENSFQIPDCPINVLFQHPELYTCSVGGAETFEQLFQRTGEFLAEIIEPQLVKGKDILIVGHGAMNCSIISRLKNLPIEQFWSAGIEQCKIMKVL